MLSPSSSRGGGIYGNKNVYYLDFFALHERTNKEQRIAQRKLLNRDKMMAYKLKLQKNMCFYCGDIIDMSGHLDHVIPVYWGGRSSKSNLVAACRSCNLTKSTGHIEITNERTIKDYLRLQQAYDKWLRDIERKPKLRAFPPKRVQLYGVYHAKYFKQV